ncbi:MAG: glycosyltransferase family 39 protein [Anaerolineae bacterium]|nr:glycosyltransferase family 39 protein [Anaerolineae bacterium]
MKRTRSVRVAVAIFILALLVRLVPQGFYVTPDEPIWVLRSVRLIDAVTTRDLTAIPRTGHPGFTTMTLGALGIQLVSWLRPVASETHLNYIRDIAWLAPESSPAFPHLYFFLNMCRAMVAIFCSGALAFLYLVSKQRLGEKTSRLLALFLALDPFYAGHAGLLHTDALQATFVLLSVIFLLLDASKQPKLTSTITSALFLALAGLSKTLGLLVAPGFVVVILLWGAGSLKQRIYHVIVLGLLSSTFFVILFPPFWREPVPTLLNLLEAITYHQSTGLRDVFFAGNNHIDPGPLF